MVDPEQVRVEMEEAFAVRILDGLDDAPPAMRTHDSHRLMPA